MRQHEPYLAQRLQCKEFVDRFLQERDGVVYRNQQILLGALSEERDLAAVRA